MATITESQRQRLGGRSLDEALTTTLRFEDDARILFSENTARQYPGKWVAVHNGRIVGGADDVDSIIAMLKDRDIPHAGSAIAFIEGNTR
jgi:hypothetical protein